LERTFLSTVRRILIHKLTQKQKLFSLILSRFERNFVPHADISEKILPNSTRL